jgi:hypothetical protein
VPARRERDDKLALAAAVFGGLRLAPVGEALQALEETTLVVEDRRLFDDAAAPTALMARRADVAKRASRGGT